MQVEPAALDTVLARAVRRQEVQLQPIAERCQPCPRHAAPTSSSNEFDDCRSRRTFSTTEALGLEGPGRARAAVILGSSREDLADTAGSTSIRAASFPANEITHTNHRSASFPGRPRTVALSPASRALAARLVFSPRIAPFEASRRGLSCVSDSAPPAGHKGRGRSDSDADSEPRFAVAAATTCAMTWCSARVSWLGGSGSIASVEMPEFIGTTATGGGDCAMLSTTSAVSDDAAFGSLRGRTTVGTSGLGNRRARISSSSALLLCIASASRSPWPHGRAGSMGIWAGASAVSDVVCRRPDAGSPKVM